jgi:hypothetical protein
MVLGGYDRNSWAICQTNHHYANSQQVEAGTVPDLEGTETPFKFG